MEIIKNENEEKRIRQELKEANHKKELELKRRIAEEIEQKRLKEKEEQQQKEIEEQERLKLEREKADRKREEELEHKEIERKKKVALHKIEEQKIIEKFKKITLLSLLIFTYDN